MERTGISSDRSWSDVAYFRPVRLDNLIEVAGTTSSAPVGDILDPRDMCMQASAFYGINELLHPDPLTDIEATAIVSSAQ